MATTIEEELERLLRGEIAAAETYSQLLGDVDGAEASALREVQREHGAAIRFLYEQLAGRGIEPPTSSGTWGVVARSVESAAKLLGDKAALAALREGERKGLADYEQALLGELPANCRTYVEDVLVPAQNRHIDALSRMIDRR